MLEAIQYPWFQRALVAGALASVACGIVGTYVIVKRMSAMAGGLSHAAFGGVGLGYFAGFDPLIGATVFALVSGAGLGVAVRRLESGIDTLVSMLWAVGMAVGLIFVALTPGSAPDLMSYLFGSILLVPSQYLGFVAALDAGLVVVVLLLFKELEAVAFDEEWARLMGVRVSWVVQAMLAMVSLTVVVLIQVVGVILVIALLTIPAAIARQWAHSLGRMMVLATLIGTACTWGGLFLAQAVAGWSLPTGPLIILLAAAAYATSSLARAVTDNRSRLAATRK